MQPQAMFVANDVHKARDIGLDVLRGIGIILVVYGHFARGLVDLGLAHHPATLKTLDFILYTTHMPLFFLIAGLNARASQIRHGVETFAKGRFWAIIYPYLFWSIMLWLSKSALAMVTAVHHPISLGALLAIPFAPISIFWFLYALLVIQLVSVPFARRDLMFLAVTLALDLAATLAAPGLPHIVVAICVHAPFFALGYVLAGRRIRLTDPRLSRLPALTALAALFAATCAAALAMRLALPVSVATLVVSLAAWLA